MLAYLSSLPGAVTLGLIWGIMALGVFISYKILDIPDLTVDGSFATGGAVCGKSDACTDGTAAFENRPVDGRNRQAVRRAGVCAVCVERGEPPGDAPRHARTSGRADAVLPRGGEERAFNRERTCGRRYC